MKFDPSDYDAIIFDLGGVILNLDYNRTIKAFEKLGMHDFESYYSQAQQNNLFDDYETGAISSNDFRAYFKTTLDQSLTNKKIDDAWNKMLLDLPEKRINLLLSIKEITPIYLFSNTNDIHLQCFRQIIADTHGNQHLLESIFTKTYYSHLLGHRKPNRSAFETVLKENSLNANNTLFIDDSEQHIFGAREAGIEAYHLVNEDITDLFILN